MVKSRKPQRCKKIKRYDTHHRKPKSKGGSDSEVNTITVLRSLHCSYHHLFANMLPKEVAKTLNDTWIDPKTELIALRRCQKLQQVKDLAKELGILL